MAAQLAPLHDRGVDAVLLEEALLVGDHDGRAVGERDHAEAQVSDLGSRACSGSCLGGFALGSLLGFTTASRHEGCGADGEASGQQELAPAELRVARALGSCKRGGSLDSPHERLRGLLAAFVRGACRVLCSHALQARCQLPRWHCSGRLFLRERVCGMDKTQLGNKTNGRCRPDSLRKKSGRRALLRSCRKTLRFCRNNIDRRYNCPRIREILRGAGTNHARH